MGSEDEQVGLGIRVFINSEGLPQVASLQQKGGAWASGMIREGDLLLAVRPEKSWVKLSGSQAEEVERILLGPVGSLIQVRVKRKEVTYDCMLERLQPPTPGPAPSPSSQGALRRRPPRSAESAAEVEQRIYDGMGRVNRARVQAMKEDGIFPDDVARRQSGGERPSDVPGSPAIDFPPDSAPGAVQSGYRGKLVVVNAEGQGRARPLIFVWLWHQLCMLLFGSFFSFSSMFRLGAGGQKGQADVERGGHSVGREDFESDSDSDSD